MSSLLDGADGKRRTYSSLSIDEKWEYHTHCYAFRMVYLGMPETTRAWDGDPSGRWFNADMIATEVSRLQRQKDKQDGKSKRLARADIRDDPLIKAQRVAFAKFKGYPNWQACLDAMWQDAVDHAHPITGQPNVNWAWANSGFEEFCHAHRDKLVKHRMAHDAQRKAQLGLAKAQRKMARKPTEADLP